jgi:hypothetical protein
VGVSGPSIAAQQRDDEVASMLQDIRDTIRTGVGAQYSPDLVQIRQAQHAHLRATGSFPRFVDVGSDVWDHAYDWHVVNQRSIEINRVGDRYQMQFLHTTLVLRPDSSSSHVGTPTDALQP